MPFYTYKCPECGKEKELLQKMNESPPTCNKCTKMVPRNIVEMERVFKANAKPTSKDGSWGFGGKKPKHFQDNFDVEISDKPPK